MVQKLKKPKKPGRVGFFKKTRVFSSPVKNQLKANKKIGKLLGALKSINQVLIILMDLKIW